MPIFVQIRMATIMPRRLAQSNLDQVLVDLDRAAGETPSLKSVGPGSPPHELLQHVTAHLNFPVAKSYCISPNISEAEHSLKHVPCPRHALFIGTRMTS
jgi:hypothetical protein